MMIATCDNEIQYCEQVENFVTRLANLLGIDVKCDKYQNGIHIAEQLRKTNEKVEIIFLSALM